LWTLLSNEDGNQITGPDSSKVMQYRSFVCGINNSKVQPYLRDTYYQPASRTSSSSLELTSNGYVTLRDMKINDVIIAGFYSDKDSLVSEKIKVKVEQVFDGPIIKGKYKYVYEAGVKDLKIDGKYYFRIMVNGVVRKEYLYAVDV
jgi:hypothetical protein